MITLTGWVLVATLNGQQHFGSDKIFKTPQDCYRALNFWPELEGDKAEYKCFYIQGKPVKFDLKVIDEK